MTIPITDLIRNVFSWLLTATMIIGMIVAGEVYNLWSPAKRRRLSRIDLCVLGAGAAAFVLAGVANKYLLALAGPLIRCVFGTLLIIALAFILFVLKQKALRAYAIIEILFGIALAAQSMYGLADVVEPLRLFGVISGVYFLVRGFDNLRRHFDERSSPPSEPKKRQWLGRVKETFMKIAEHSPNR
jgi:hypothetical protein